MKILISITLAIFLLPPQLGAALDIGSPKHVQTGIVKPLYRAALSIQKKADLNTQVDYRMTRFFTTPHQGNLYTLHYANYPISAQPHQKNDSKHWKGGILATFVKKHDLVYATTNGISLKLDLILPNAPGPHPLIIWIHGGGWHKGNKKLRPTHPAHQQVKRGYAVASIEYRLSQQAIFPAQIYDCKAAIRWLRGNAQRFDLNPTRFAVWGSSAGGHLSALLGTSGDVSKLEDLSMGYPDSSSRVQAVVDWYGPTDFTKMGGKHDKASSPESLLIGCPIQSCPEKTAAANPITYISPDDPPFLIQHGTRDKVVPYSQSRILYEALRSANLQATLIPLEGARHTDPRFTSAENVTLVEDFLDKNLRN